MNGIVDDTGKVALGTVEALKHNPLVLALVLINLAFLLGGAFVLHRVANTNTQWLAALTAACNIKAAP